MARKISALVEIGAVMSSNVNSVFGGLNKKIDALNKQAGELKKSTKEVQNLAKAEAGLLKTRNSLNAARKGGDSAAIGKARAAFEKQTASVEKMRAALKGAGVDTGKLSSENERLSRTIAGVETRMASLGRMGTRLTALRGSLSGVRGAFGNLRSNLGSLATRGAVGGAAAGYGFKKYFLDEAVTKESMDARLSSTMGSDEKGKKAFSWIDSFTEKTPFKIQAMEQAFVKLKNSGLDPTSGVLQAIADQTAAVGGNSDSMEGIARALGQMVTNTRIQAEEMNQLSERDVPAWDLLAKAMKKDVATVRKLGEDGKLGLKEINALIFEMGKRYQGSAVKMSKTWTGLMARMSNKWFKFSNMVMEGGTFDFLKGKLDNFFKSLEGWEKDGTLKKWAEDTSNFFGKIYRKLDEWIPKLYAATLATKDFVGGWGNLGIVIAAIAFAPTIASVVQLGVAIGGVGKALGALAFGPLFKSLGVMTGLTWAAAGPWVLLAGAIALAASAIYFNWGGIGDWFSKNIYEPIAGQVNKLIEKFTELWDWIAKTSVGKFLGMGENGYTYVPLPGSTFTGPQPLMNGPVMRPNDPMGYTGRGADKANQFSRNALMPADKMPAVNGGTINNKVDVQIDARGADAADVLLKFRSSLESRPLFDQQSVLAPR